MTRRFVKVSVGGEDGHKFEASAASQAHSFGRTRKQLWGAVPSILTFGKIIFAVYPAASIGVRTGAHTEAFAA